MKSKKVHKAREVFKIKNHIYKVIPYAKDIDIKIDKADNGGYESLIKVHIPPRKCLIAVKRDNSLKVSLERSKQAILRQIHKIKTRKASKRKLQYKIAA